MNLETGTGYGEREIQPGMKVRAANGDNLGKVTECNATGFTIEKGFFFPKDRTASYQAVSAVRDGEVWLAYGADQLRALDDDVALAGVQPDDIDLERGAAGEQRMPLVEEELDVQKRAKSAGEVRVAKDVNEERKQVTVPVTKEDVVVERVPGDGQPGAIAAGQAEITIPLTEEEVDVQKRPVVKEELRVKKVARTEEKTIDEPVKKETARIESSGKDPTRR